MSDLRPTQQCRSSLLRTTFVRAAYTARKQDPQLARIYYVQMVERGKTHLGALCVVAANLAERAWTVMNRASPYVICDSNGRPVTPDEAAAIIAEHWTVPTDVRERRWNKKSGKAPKPSHRDDVNGATSPPDPSSTRRHERVNQLTERDQQLIA